MKFELYREAGRNSLASLLAGSDWRWRLKANNGQIIATSGEGYQNKHDCLSAIELVMGTSMSTTVYDIAEGRNLTKMTALGGWN
ncbi:YegP family protein [Xanthomonas arboricola]|uniref:YegP family protein n=1 Tax=Xanthomonas arboricola TaxID=56448 RepID=UPI0023BA0C73|nr:YegP family protein [Xanthomonas arboricola]